jgi:hypothetical protein
LNELLAYAAVNPLTQQVMVPLTSYGPGLAPRRPLNLPALCLCCTPAWPVSRPIAQAIQEEVEEPTCLLTLFRRAGCQGDSADADHDVGGIDIAPQRTVVGARFQ